MTRLQTFMQQIAKDTYPEFRTSSHNEITAQVLPDITARLPKGARVLDVGCGQGPALAMFVKQGFNALGIALNETDVAECQKQGFNTILCDQNDMPEYFGESFDLVWARHVLEHSVAPYFTLAEYFRVLKPAGILYLEMPSPETSCNHEWNRNHYAVFSDKMWTSLIWRSGFCFIRGKALEFETGAGPDKYFSYLCRKPDPAKFDRLLLNDIKVPAQFGVGMEPFREVFAAMIMKAAQGAKNGFSYLEVGIFQLGTMQAVRELLQQLPDKSYMLGLDLPTDPMGQRERVAELFGDSTKVHTGVVFKESKDADIPPVHFVFIDGCHCREHVAQDWASVKDKVLPGGIVAFHDTSPDCQDKELQWDGKPIQVRAFLNETGLLADKVNGWRLLLDDKFNMNGITFFERL